MPNLFRISREAVRAGTPRDAGAEHGIRRSDPPQSRVTLRRTTVVVARGGWVAYDSNPRVDRWTTTRASPPNATVTPQRTPSHPTTNTDRTTTQHAPPDNPDPPQPRNHHGAASAANNGADRTPQTLVRYKPRQTTKHAAHTDNEGIVRSARRARTRRCPRTEHHDRLQLERIQNANPVLGHRI